MSVPAVAYFDLIEKIECLLSGAIRSGARGSNLEILESSVHDVIEGLKSESAKTAIAKAFTELDPIASRVLCAELEYITSTIPCADHSQYANADERIREENDAASNVKTGKDSLESLLGDKLPKWLLNLLTLLNEILSLVFKV
jgi:hypothetical protein